MRDDVQPPDERMADNHADNHADDNADLGRVWVAAILVGAVVGALAILVGVRGEEAQGHQSTFPAVAPDEVGPEADADQPGTFAVPPPPFKSEAVLDSLEETGKPCSGCHDEDLEPNPERRELDMHDEIVLQHDEEHRWCLDCHDAQDRDRLRLASGVLVEFSESYRLCGQCHGDKYRDWRQGIHGRRKGEWNGKKEYMLCVHCHYAHAPAFDPIAPAPRPRRPSEVGMAEEER